MTETITTLADADALRAERIQALRDLIDVLEANPHVPAPEFISFPGGAYDGTQLERFNKLHDIADAFGLEVKENADGDRIMNGKYGPLTLVGRAWADAREKSAALAPRVVQRPAANGDAR